jgi:hypothetical protein
LQNQLKASFTIWCFDEKEIIFFPELSYTKQAQVQLSLVGVNAGIHLGLKLFLKNANLKIVFQDNVTAK